MLDCEFMDVVEIFEKESKCAARKICCVITNEDKNILSIGINGTLSKRPNCKELFERNPDTNVVESIDKENYILHHEWSLLNEIHAEQNAIYKATQEMNCNLKGTTFYISACPCVNCAKMLALYGIKKVVFRDLYDDSDKVIKFLKENNIEVYQYKKDSKNVYNESKSLFKNLVKF